MSIEFYRDEELIEELRFRGYDIVTKQNTFDKEELDIILRLFQENLRVGSKEYFLKEKIFSQI